MRRAGIFPERQLPGCSCPSLRQELSRGLGAHEAGCLLKSEVRRRKRYCCARGMISKSSDRGKQPGVWLSSKMLVKDETSSCLLGH